MVDARQRRDVQLSSRGVLKRVRDASDVHLRRLHYHLNGRVY